MADRPDTQNGLQWRVSGVKSRLLQDIYPRLMGTSWSVTIGWAFTAYTITCLVFAGLFAIQPDSIKGASSLSDLLWFSVQTLSTIGYGGMTPITPWSNLLVMIESFIGLAGVAVVTAILYAKFSLPDARVQFSERVGIHDHSGVPTLHIRMLNERTTPILDVNLHAGVLVAEMDGGRQFNRMVDLTLVREHVPMFAMAFTLMHTLDQTSVLHDLQQDPDRMVFLLVTLRGVDGRTLQPIFARALYRHDQLAFRQGFVDIVGVGADGVMEVDAGKLDGMMPRTLTPTR